MVSNRTEKQCPICKKWFKSLGYARHRTKHYDERQRNKEQGDKA